MLYVARHGQTVWNAQNKVCGVTDVELTENGKEQAKDLAYEVQENGIDIIISSPLKRAVETSRIVSEICNIPFEIDERLIEQNYGIYEGVDRKKEEFLNNKKCFAFKYPNGESMMQVAYRIYGLLDEIKYKYSDKNVLVISHGGVCRIINTYFRDMTNDEFFNYTLENAKLEKYEW
ncbi:MAG: histidine phosphatase family protein [Roseburia sp.]|nr:histidine phosphatase family protein [Roseburia sp.]